MKKPSSESSKDSAAAAAAAKELAARLSEAEIPRRYRDITFAAVADAGLPQKDPRWQSNYQAITSFRQDLRGHFSERGEGVILYGARGQMKTTMAVALLREYIDAGGHGFFIPMCSLADRLRSLWANDAIEAASFDQRMRRTGLLVIDDLGAESTEKDWVLNKIESIVTDRYNERQATIITSNLSLREMVGTYSARLIDRLKESALLLEYTGQSLRQKFTL